MDLTRSDRSALLVMDVQRGIISRFGDEVRTLVLTGIATSGVVLSTLRQAADLDYQLVVLSDGCLDADWKPGS